MIFPWIAIGLQEIRFEDKACLISIEVDATLCHRVSTPLGVCGTCRSIVSETPCLSFLCSGMAYCIVVACWSVVTCPGCAPAVSAVFSSEIHYHTKYIAE